MVLAVGYAGSFSARFRACTESTSLIMLQVPQSSSRGRRLAAAATSGTTTSRTSSWQQTWVRPQPAACCPVLGCCRQRITMAADLVKPHTLGLCMEHTLLRMQRSFAAVPDCVAACCPAAVLGREPHNNLCLKGPSLPESQAAAARVHQDRSHSPVFPGQCRLVIMLLQGPMLSGFRWSGAGSCPGRG